jgi:hypothetical protein
MTAQASLAVCLLALCGLALWVWWARRVSARWVGRVMRPELGPGSVVEVRGRVESNEAQRAGSMACRR